MSIYSTRPGFNNSTLYIKDGRPIKKLLVPANVYAELQAGKEKVDDEGMKLEAPIKQCIFCGQVCKLSRLVNLQTVYMCEEHYYDKTMGQIAQQLREVSSG